MKKSTEIKPVEEKVKRRGRPKKNTEDNVITNEKEIKEETKEEKPKRGRKKKEVEEAIPSMETKEETKEEKPKRGRKKKEVEGAIPSMETKEEVVEKPKRGRKKKEVAEEFMEPSIDDMTCPNTYPEDEFATCFEDEEFNNTVGSIVSAVSESDEEEILMGEIDEESTSALDTVLEVNKIVLNKKDMKNFQMSKFGARQIVKNYYTKQGVRMKYAQQYSNIVRSVDLAKKNMEKFDSGEITLKEIFEKKFPSYTEEYMEHIMDMARKYDDIHDCDDVAMLKLMIDIEKYGEDAYKITMEKYAKEHPIGRWLLSITGIGPVFAVGLISYIDIYKCPTVGSIWKYAGWQGPGQQMVDYGNEQEKEIIGFEDPRFDWDQYIEAMMSTRRRAGHKITWNPDFRKLLFKIGESFIKIQNSENPSALYGRIYKEKLIEYTVKNELGGFCYNAKAELECKNCSPESESYKAYIQGKLPKGQLMAMARRYAVKIFLSHLHQVWYEFEFGTSVPKPFPVKYLGHVHISEPINRDKIYSNK